MKLNFFESEYGVDITLIPESTNEMAQLLRAIKNIRKEKPSISFNFYPDSEPKFNIWFKKILPSKQENSIR